MTEDTRITVEELKQNLLNQFIEEHSECLYGYCEVLLRSYVGDLVHFVFDIAYDRGWGDCEADRLNGIYQLELPLD